MDGTGAEASQSRTGSASTTVRPSVATSSAEPGSRSSSAFRGNALGRAADDNGDEEDAGEALGSLRSQGGSSRLTPQGQARGSSSAVSAQQLAEERQEEEVMQRLQGTSTDTAQSSSRSTRPKNGSTTASTMRPTRSTGSQSSSDARSSARMAELDDEFGDDTSGAGGSSDRELGVESVRGGRSGSAGRGNSPRSGTARASNRDDVYTTADEEFGAAGRNSGASGELIS